MVLVSSALGGLAATRTLQVWLNSEYAQVLDEIGVKPT
jgi:hypothetical protein